MVEEVRLITCDACRKSVKLEDPKYPDNWLINTEIGDLCPSCSNAWSNYKRSFVEKMRLESKEAVI